MERSASTAEPVISPLLAAGADSRHSRSPGADVGLKRDRSAGAGCGGSRRTSAFRRSSCGGGSLDGRPFNVFNSAEHQLAALDAR